MDWHLGVDNLRQGDGNAAIRKVNLMGELNMYIITRGCINAIAILKFTINNAIATLESAIKNTIAILKFTIDNAIAISLI